MAEFIYWSGYAVALALLGIVSFAIGRVWIMQPIRSVLRRAGTSLHSKLIDMRWWLKRVWRWPRGYND